MSQHPLGVFERIDPEFLKHVDNAHRFALADGALPTISKLVDLGL